jgi:DNA end-binding protein Ku
VEISEHEMRMAVQLIDELTVPFKPENLKSTYVEKLEEIIDKKMHGETIKGKKITVKKSSAVPDLMATLKASLVKAHQQKSSHKSHKSRK